MESIMHQGVLVLADISGYTFFLTNTELEHANIALSYLLEAILEKLSNTLTIIKLEGDAVFAFVEDGNLPQGTPLLDLLDQTYLAFREQVEQLKKKATCPCKACQEIPTLDLKFMVHHGSFMIQRLAGIQDLLGSDVTLVHRLLKNKVTESTGWRGYALFTRQGMETVRAAKESLIQQSETYEHLGEIQTYVMDMHPRYESLKSAMPAVSLD